MACKNTNYQQEMVERETEVRSNYSTIAQRSKDDEIQLNKTIQNTPEHQQKELMCNSKIKLGLVILGIITLAVSSCIITVIILKQKIDSLSEAIESMKLNTSRDFIFNKPVMDQESNWLEWTNWSGCSSKCSGGIQRRGRTCDGSGKGPHVCVGNDVDIAACNNNTCVESNWLDWTNWSGCSSKCSGGIQRRGRTCDGSGKGPHVCVGNDVDIAACNNNTCVESNWLEWTNWSGCSSKCSEGIQRRGRTCDGSGKGPHVCVGNDVDIAACNNNTCVESNWLEWTNWSGCSSKCSGGIQRRGRTCDGSGKGPHVCVGNDVDITACNNNTCVESNWLDWTNWSGCSSKCSGGIQRRGRTCDGSGKGPHVCVGNDVDITACNNNTCVESNWLDWTNWSGCSSKCSGGIQRRGRTCDGSGKGPHVCVGNDVDIAACNNNTCVESNWLEWTNWSGCSSKCSRGIQRRGRTCDGSGKGPHVCVGNDVDIAACNNNTCVESNWLEWTNWSGCSSKCGGGIQRRGRTCDGSGKEPHVCVGNDVDITACNNNTCVESNWLEWTNWSGCSSKCSGGIQRRGRTCDGSGKGPHVCVGNDVDIAACNNNTCVESNWLEWTNWSGCSSKCSGGIQRRGRTCDGSGKGPHVCVGNDVDIATCNNNTCVESKWLEWTNWSGCSSKCGGGIQRRGRTCDGSGKGPHVCVGNDVDITACNNNTCVGIWTTWSSWKSCTVTCGMGLQRRDRTCTQPNHGPHGNMCIGDNSDFKVCTTRACEDNIWSTWSPWGDCSVTCNGGIRTRMRTCDGTDQGVQQVSCSGNNVDIGGCNNNACVAPMVYFTMRGPSSRLVSEQVTFVTTIANVGGGYNKQTGEFVCSVAGLYHFYFSFIQVSSTYVSCYIKRNGKLLTYAYTESDKKKWYAASTSAYLQMAVGDVVTVGDCTNWQHANHAGHAGVFTGSLIHL